MQHATRVPALQQPRAAALPCKHMLLPARTAAVHPAVSTSAGSRCSCVAAAGPASSSSSSSSSSPPQKKKGFGAQPRPAALETCPCGSKRPSRECCGPILEGTAPAASAEAQLRARFTAYTKRSDGAQEYLVRTFAPAYLQSKYAGMADDEARTQLKLDVRMACRTRTYFDLKILKTEQGASADEALIEFSYKMTEAVAERRTNSRKTREKAQALERNLDGSLVVTTVIERSRFVRDAGCWLLAGAEPLQAA